MIKKLKFLLLCLMCSFAVYGMNRREIDLREEDNQPSQTIKKLKNRNLGPVETVHEFLEKKLTLKVKPAFPFWEKIKAIISPSYPIPNKKLIEESTEIYFEDSQNKNKTDEETKKNHKEALINTLHLIGLDQEALNKIKKENKEVEAEARNKFDNGNELIPLKSGFIEKYRGYALVTGGAIVGCIVAHSLARNQEFQPATLIEDEKIIPLGFKGICIKLIGFLSGAVAGGMLEWKTLSTSIASKLIERWNLKKETIKNKMTECKSPDKKGYRSDDESSRRK